MHLKMQLAPWRQVLWQLRILIARLILSRYFGQVIVHSSNLSASSQGEGTHLDL
ncbi:hypothetical protein JHK85_011232 [Glycine max]|uniref:Uncharacterized protein n=2 Tax=Glycine subgen. Soja TaxID=1462606 RepID=A0A0R0KAU7_SOYBN|nr:hypothetical protein JHK87_010788 [Glycine soja]KAG5050129.1 hypothetical protein JHK85_011232 [Glycine max]KAG5067187.1 hypothetical protein JHK86_010918 [Glycine max]RZC17600.1 hypothetical protein D0Y65_010382 [Glycine soja]